MGLKFNQEVADEIINELKKCYDVLFRTKQSFKGVTISNPDYPHEYITIIQNFSTEIEKIQVNIKKQSDNLNQAAIAIKNAEQKSKGNVNAVRSTSGTKMSGSSKEEISATQKIETIEIPKYSKDYWTQTKQTENYEKTKKMYDEKQITENQFNIIYIVQIIDTEDWIQMELDLKNGFVTEEIYTLIQQIKNITENWDTAEAEIKKLVDSVPEELWNSAETYVGTLLCRYILNAGIFTTINSVIMEEDWVKSWIEENGWKLILEAVDAGIIAIDKDELTDKEIKEQFTSMDIEAKIKYLDERIGKGIKAINEASLTIESDFLERAKVELFNRYINGKIDLKSMNEIEITEEINKIILNLEQEHLQLQKEEKQIIIEREEITENLKINKITEEEATEKIKELDMKQKEIDDKLNLIIKKA